MTERENYPEWKSKVYEQIGAASMLLEGGRIFDPTRAIEIAETIIATVWQAGLASQQGAKGVLGEVAEERKRQDAKWGGPEHDDTHVIGDWLTFIVERVKMISLYRTRTANEQHALDRRDLVQIAALAVAAIESHDRLVEREHE